MSRTLHQRMGDAHEAHLAEAMGGRRSRGSGNQWRDQMDGRNDPAAPYALAWDGKALGVSATLMTPTGSIKMGDVQVGDLLLDLHGGTTRVQGVFPQGERQMYGIEFSDGTSVQATGDHLWGVHQRTTRIDSGRQRSQVVERVWTTDRLRSLSRAMLRSVWLPAHLPVAFNTPLPQGWVTPYVLGALLGDGKMGEGSVVLTSADAEIVHRVSVELPVGMEVTKFADRQTCAQYRIKGRDARGRIFPQVLLDSGVTRCNSPHESIPEPYLYAPEEARWALLQGLMDTDGWVEKGAGRFVSSSVTLRDQVAWLGRSLGLRVNTYARSTPTYRHAGESRLGRPAYQATLGYHPRLFHLSRKTALLRPAARQFHRTFWGIEEAGVEQAQCISVEATDGMFLVEDFVPTHNSTLGASLSVSLRTWDKAREQAGNEIPMLGLRFYDNERLDVCLDLAVVDLLVLSELAAMARLVEGYRACCKDGHLEMQTAITPCSRCGFCCDWED